MPLKYRITTLETTIDSPGVGCAYFMAHRGATQAPIGLLRPELDEPAGVIRTLYVEPEHRGAGLGSMLLEAAFERCRKACKESVGLWVNNENEGAQRLYRKHGFVKFLGGYESYTQYVKVL